MTSTADRVRADLDYLADAWPDLLTARLHGTNRPWNQPPDITPTERLRRDAAARAERLDRFGIRTGVGRSPTPPGEHPAPAHVDVLDTIATVVHAAQVIAQQVTQQAGAPPIPPGLSAWSDPREQLTHARAWLSAATTTDPHLPDWAATQLRPIVDAVARALHEVRDGQTLATICPWCDGRTESHPNGGARTLTVKEPHPGTCHICDALGAAAIVCMGTNCNPGTEHCGSVWHGGRPAWPEREWQWLAEQLQHPALPETA